MSVPWPEPDEGASEHGLPEGDQTALDESALVAVVSDPYARVHEALARSVAAGEVPPGWHLTDFLVVAAAESSRAGEHGQVLMLLVEPRDSMSPHRVLGLLDYARRQYAHRFSCCSCIDRYDPDEDDD